MYVGGGRKPKFLSQYLLKLEFPALSIPILASVSFRQLPWASVSFRGLWSTIASYFVGMQTTMYVGWGRKPKSLRQYLPKIKVRSAGYPNFSFRQLPPASVGFRGVPRTMGNHFLIYCRGADNNVCGWVGAGSQSAWADIYLKLKPPSLFIPILASASFCQLP